MRAWWRLSEERSGTRRQQVQRPLGREGSDALVAEAASVTVLQGSINASSQHGWYTLQVPLRSIANTFRRT